MPIKFKYMNRSGQILDTVYFDEKDPLLNIEGRILNSIKGFCFYKDKMVMVYSQVKGYWLPPGGGIDPGETYEEAMVREIKEETNMKVLHQEVIGFQDAYENGKILRQIRSFCIVEPHGDFISDPDEGEVIEMKLIDPADYKEYFDWGEVGDLIMQKALEMKERFYK
ncbi:hypothetical protein A3J19_01625 [Candidatus Daviesbacteria bacterium RIFCSPLOWO2_02_FULL_41_8]|uniref:Nudix hydrolase domain-containing protein n=1 Tax=Candidatus Daviesbacteria bacterium RIFCSPLOWO2_02_FULL_41_8 TaxID=1797798 RepID=A0A1F5NJ35_9BACT|nr:MAG: hypothetical protein A3J19_01625 [Candidatus Daviesbacteria bacterium RIFCSPLOWO2_02_FULL_41_8]